MMLYEKSANKIHNLEFFKSVLAEVLYNFDNDGRKERIPSIVLDDGSGVGYSIPFLREHSAKEMIKKINKSYRDKQWIVEIE